MIIACLTASASASHTSTAKPAAREVVNVLSGKGQTTEIKDPGLLAEAQDEGFGGV